MGNPNEMDFGGLTLVVEDIKVGATAPGQAGTALSGALEATSLETTGDVTVGGDIVMGATTLTEAQLIELLALL